MPEIVSPMRPLLMTSICAPGRNAASSRRITCGYVASEPNTHNPVVEDEPKATTRSAPALRCAAARGSGMPMERVRLAARQTSAADCAFTPWAPAHRRTLAAQTAVMARCPSGTTAITVARSLSFPQGTRLHRSMISSLTPWKPLITASHQSQWRGQGGRPPQWPTHPAIPANAGQEGKLCGIEIARGPVACHFPARLGRETAPRKRVAIRSATRNR